MEAILRLLEINQTAELKLRISYQRIHKPWQLLSRRLNLHSTKNCGLNQVRIAYVLNNRDLIDAIGLIRDGLTEYLEK